MPSIKWTYIRFAPITAVKLVTQATLGSIQAVLKFIVHPSQPLSLRTAFIRPWIIAIVQYKPELIYGEPEGVENIQVVKDGKFKGYLLPSVKPDKLIDFDAVLLYAHGGGLVMGHPLQYLDEYKRWIARTEMKGKKLAVLAVKYPLSVQQKWPAQLDAMIAAYRWLLSQNVPASHIIFGGDSAGANLIQLTLLHIRDKSSPLLPQPSAAVLYSTQADMSGANHRDSVEEWDFLKNHKQVLPFINDILRPEGLPRDSPEISALLAADVGRLAPQLVFWSTTEFLAPDSQRWIERSVGAGVEIMQHRVSGQLHTYGLGWPFVTRKLQDECDEILVEYVLGHVGVKRGYD